MPETVPVNFMKCACPACVCVFEVEQGIEHKGKLYCAPFCAGEEPEAEGCGHRGCRCGLAD